MKTSEVRVAAVQLTSGADPTSNVERAAALVLHAVDEGASYVQLPEYVTYRGPTKNYLAVAETIPGPTTERLAAIAKERGVTVHVGSLLEQSTDPAKSHNTSVVIAPDGTIAATYRKGHLFDVNVPGEIQHHESKDIVAGDQLVVTETEGFSLGLSVCFDLRFPDLYQQLALHGATVLAVPSSFAVATGRVHWEVLLRARAIENHAYVIAAAQAGTTTEGVSSFGHSMIIDPWGGVRAESDSEGEDVLVATIDLGEVERRRTQISVHDLRRPELYRSLPDA
jgi:deaminated glutathione amidase